MKQLAISLLDVPEQDWKFEIKKLEIHNQNLKVLYCLPNEAIRLHLDKIEYPYVPKGNEKFSMSFLEEIARSTHLECDLHLMVKNPIETATSVSKNTFAMVYIHHIIPQADMKIDTPPEIEDLTIGRAFNPDEPLTNSQNILIMTVFPGKGGQKMIIPDATRKKLFIQLWEDKNSASMERKGTIACDGGVTADNIHELRDFCDIFVIGSNYFKNDPDMRYEYLKKVCGRIMYPKK